MILPAGFFHLKGLGRAMAKEMGLSQSTASRIWRAFGLQPPRQETFKLSRDPLLVEKTRDIAGSYLVRPVKALPLCVYEKSQIQALDRAQPILRSGGTQPAYIQSDPPS